MSPTPVPTPPHRPSRSRRLFCPGLSDASGELYPLDAGETRHARTVLRLPPGAAVELFDGNGALAEAVIERYDGGRALCRVIERRVADPPRPRITLACAIPRGPRADGMIDQLSQLGVDRLVPLRTARSVVDPRPGRIDRFQRRAVEACKQSRRPFTITIDPPRDFGDVLSESADVRVLLVPDSEVVRVEPNDASSVLALIGPEGGWTEDEVAAARAAGFARWTIGPYVLRIETAAASAATLLRHLGETHR